jgi:hypothetical protein
LDLDWIGLDANAGIVEATITSIGPRCSLRNGQRHRRPFRLRLAAL